MYKSKLLYIIVLLISFFLFSCTNKPLSGNNGIIVTTSLEGKPVLIGKNLHSFPLVSNETSLNILSSVSNNDDYNQVYVWQKYQEMTNVKINWKTVSKDERAKEVYNSLINSHDVDLIIRCKLSSNLITQYGEKGLILNLTKNNLLERYAPNCWAYLQSHPDTLASITNPDGAIYALPQVNSGAELRVSRKIFINKKWLENLDMEIPTTTDELYNLLKAFKEKDANGNGNPNDEIPLSSSDMLSLQEVFYGAFGLMNRGLHNMEVDWDEVNNKPRYIASSSSYLEFLKFMYQLYSEKLLDQYIFTMTDTQWRYNLENDLIGIFANTNLAGIPASKANDWVTLDEALEGPNGDKIWSAIRANFHSTGAAVVPTTCKNPELVLRWLDYFWTDEGSLFYHLGIENETFIVNEDGTYDYMPYVYETMNKENKSFDDVVRKISPYPGGSNPTVEIAPYFKGGEMADLPAQAARNMFIYGPKEYWPSFTYTADENERLNSIKSDLDKYVNNMFEQFITGEISLNTWNNYLNELNRLGIDELLTIYEKAINRYETIYVKNK